MSVLSKKLERLTTRYTNEENHGVVDLLGICDTLLRLVEQGEQETALLAARVAKLEKKSGTYTGARG